MSKSNTKQSIAPKGSDDYCLSSVAPPSKALARRHTVVTNLRNHSEVVNERLDEQYRRVMEVAGNIEAAKEAWSRSGLVSGVEVGKQTEATEAMKKMNLFLKVAAEALVEIASRIAPPVIWQYGEDSILEHYCAVEVAAEPILDDGRPVGLKQEVAHG